jgi:microcystin-dependent protein
MSDFFIGEIRVFPFGRVPTGWHLCDGAVLQIQQNTALFSLLSNKFGGDGKTTFALPDLRGRTMLNQGTIDGRTYAIGVTGGAETVALAQTQVPLHTHTFQADKAATGLVATPNNALPAAPTSPTCYAAQAQSPAATMAADSLSTVGGQAHNNMQPSLVLNYCISTTGIYPSRQ